MAMVTVIWCSGNIGGGDGDCCHGEVDGDVDGDDGDGDDSKHDDNDKSNHNDDVGDEVKSILKVPWSENLNFIPFCINF